jgi:hypothetical protein
MQLKEQLDNSFLQDILEDVIITTVYLNPWYIKGPVYKYYHIGGRDHYYCLYESMVYQGSTLEVLSITIQ